MSADIEQLVLRFFVEEDLVFEDVAIVLEKVDIPYVAITYAEVNGLVTFCVFYALDHCHCL